MDLEEDPLPGFLSSKATISALRLMAKEPTGPPCWLVSTPPSGLQPSRLLTAKSRKSSAMVVPITRTCLIVAVCCLTCCNSEDPYNNKADIYTNFYCPNLSLFSIAGPLRDLANENG